MKKIINSTNDKYEAQLTEEWVLDDTPTEGSFNAVTSNGVAKAIAEGGGTTYTAGDGIDITAGEISAKLADGSGLRFDDGGLQIVHQLATPGAEDEGKVLTVTNNLGAYAWRDPSGGGLESVATSGALSGTGTQADPIAINVGNGLSQVQASAVHSALDPVYVSSASFIKSELGDTSSSKTFTLTLTGSAEAPTTLRASSNYSQQHQKHLRFAIRSGNVLVISKYSLATSTTGFLQLNFPNGFSLTQTVTANLRMLDHANGSFVAQSWDDSFDWEGANTTKDAFFADGQTYIELFLVAWDDSTDTNCGSVQDNSSDYATHWEYTSTAFSASLAVTNPLPASLGWAGQVLSVNSGANGVEWKTLSTLPSYSSNESSKILRVSAEGNACSWDDQVKCFKYTSSFSGYYNAIAEACLLVSAIGYPPVCMIIPGGSAITGYPLNSGALYSTDNVCLTLVSYDSNWATTADRCIVFSGITYAGSDLYVITYKQTTTSGFMGALVPTHSLTASKLSIAT